MPTFAYVAVGADGKEMKGTMKENRIKSVIETNASDYFPVDMSNYRVSYSLLERVEGGENPGSRVLVMAAPRVLLESYVKLAEAAGLVIEAIDFCGNSQYQVLRGIKGEGTVMYVDVNVNNTFVTFMNDGVMLEYKYRYTYSCTEIESDGTTAHKTKLWPLTDYHMVTSNLFPQGFDCTKTPSIYLMYNPWYSTVNLGSGEYNNSVGDKIEIYNKNNLAFKLFLVKEKISNLTTAMEIQYAADIVLYQDSVSIVSNAKVYSNAKENLMEPVGNQKIVNVSFKKQGIVMHTPQSFAGYDFKSEASENDVVSKSAKSRIYKITIMLYDTNNTDEDITSGTLVSTFTATKLQ